MSLKKIYYACFFISMLENPKLFLVFYINVLKLSTTYTNINLICEIFNIKSNSGFNKLYTEYFEFTMK